MKHTKRHIIIGALPTLGVVLATTNVKADDISEKAGLIASPEIKAVPNGEQNFNATVSLTSSAGLGSGTLINEDTIVTVAHNFVHLEGSNPITVANNVKKQGQVHTATLPDGTKVTFSNDDIKFWNRDGFVNGFKNDLAVVKLKNKFTGKKAADLTTSAKTLKQGDTIHVFGYPQGKLQPILNEKVQTVENYGANIMGIGYQGSHPGASGGGMYDDKGNLIGVHQNGVVGVRSGGITFSKEQLDWVASIANNAEKPPVYLPDEPRNDDKNKDEGKHGKLLEIDDQSNFGWIGELYEDGTYVMKGLPVHTVSLNNNTGGVESMFGDGASKNYARIKRFEISGTVNTDLFQLIAGESIATNFHPTVLGLRGLKTSKIPWLTSDDTFVKSVIFDNDYSLSNISHISEMFSGATSLKLTNEQVTQLLKNFTPTSLEAPLWDRVGVERLDLSTFDNSGLDLSKQQARWRSKTVFKDLIGLKEVVFGDKFDFAKYSRKNTPDAFMSTDLSGVTKVTLSGKKTGNDKFVKDWLTDVKKVSSADTQGVYLDGKFIGNVDDFLNVDGKVYEDGIYTLGPIKKEPEKKVDYTLDENPYLIVKEPSDTPVEQDPGLVKALETINAVKGHDEWVKEAQSKIEKLMNMKTGVVYKVRSHEANGKDGWRYFRTWTKYNSISGAETQIPYVEYISDGERSKGSVMYTADETLEYGKARGVSISNDKYNNVALVKWASYAPEERDENPLPSDPDFVTSVIDKATLYVRYAGDDSTGGENLIGNEVTRFVGAKIGTKPEETEEVIETRGVKYVRNEELTKLGLKERVVKEGSDKIKRTKKVYTLLRKSDESKSIKGYHDDVFVTKGTTAPSIENGGVKVEETVTYTNLEDKIIEVATPGDKVIEKIIEPEIEYVSDPTRESGTDNIVTLGPKGKSVTTTTYDVDQKTGKVTEVVDKPIITPAGKTIIKVGTKPKVTTTPIASPIEYVLDKNKPRTSPNETKPGKAGSTVTTINYTVDPNTGKAIPGTPITETTPPTKTIITVGGRNDEETEVIPPEIEYVPDDTNPGETIQGKPGKKVTPITYTIDPDTGTVTPHKGEPIITPPTKTIIKVSTKPKVVTEDIEPGTRYEADPTRDKGTPNVTIPGKKGKKVTTTTYTLDKATGKTIEHTDKPVITPPVDTIIKVGTKTKVITEIIEPGIEYVRDDNNTGEKIQGKPGKKVITITYTVDPNTGNVTENTGKPEITLPINTIVKIGTKDDVINEPIEPEVIYEGDDTRDANTPNVTIPGKQGKKTTLITYELEPGTGKRIEKRGTPRVTPPINTIVKVGTKPKVITKVIEPEVLYEGDVTHDANTPNVTIPSKKGFMSTTTTYTVDPKTGKLTEKTTEKNEAPGKTIVKVGVKPKVVTELIDPEVVYEGDDTQDVNSPNVTSPGTKRTKTTTTTYTVDPKTGKLTEKTTESGTKPGTTRIKVGTKPTVKRVTDPNGDVYEETTTYTVDPKTGKVTPRTTRKLISKATTKDPNDGAKAGNGIDENGNPIKPPVLEVPEYTGVIAGNGLDGEGNIIEPPVLEVPEYTGVIAGNGLDGEGNIIEPPVFEVPEYKGDLNNKPKEEPKQELTAKEEPKATVKAEPKQDTKKKLPETGDNNPAYLASLAVLGIGLLRRKRQK